MGKLTQILGIIMVAALLLGGGARAPVSAAPAEWSVPMTATTATEGTNDQLEFGTRIGATDSFDSGIDVPHPPPILPLDAYFLIVHETFDQLDKDYRGEADSIQWTLEVTSSEEAITLSWDASAVPANASLRLTDTEIDIDMKTVDNIVLVAAHSLTIKAEVAPVVVVVIGISVTPTSVDFGSLIPGEPSATKTVTVTNTGNVAEDFSATIENESPTGVYTGTPGLTMGGNSVAAWLPTGVVVNGTEDAGLILTVPTGTAPGTYTATLVFWAEAAGP